MCVCVSVCVCGCACVCVTCAAPSPEPSFVRVQLIPDSAERNDDKLYFFFREQTSEVGQRPKTLARIGRICLVSVREGVCVGHMACGRACVCVLVFVVCCFFWCCVVWCVCVCDCVCVFVNVYVYVYVCVCVCVREYG